MSSFIFRFIWIWLFRKVLNRVPNRIARLVTVFLLKGEVFEIRYTLRVLFCAPSLFKLLWDMFLYIVFSKVAFWKEWWL